MGNMPQLRVLATNYCASKCIYCQPSGEGNIKVNSENSIDINEVIQVAELYKQYGGNEVKITGGDPVFWPDLVECVRMLKSKLNFDKVEVITRSPNILSIIDDLIAAGLDTLNFSLDSLIENTYKHITSCCNFEQYLDAIKTCSNKPIYCKINAVIMKGINDMEIQALVDYCVTNNIKQLKFLDVIDDLQDDESQKRCDLHNLFLPLTYISNNISQIASQSEIIYQGGLGHPMNKYTLSSGLEIVIKNSQNGAWYGEECKQCRYFPCHDALMAMRLCPDKVFQMCLLNREKNISYDDTSRKENFLKMLNIFKNAHFVETSISKW